MKLRTSWTRCNKSWMRWWFSALPIAIFSLLSCKKNEEKVPSYLHIRPFQLVTNTSTEGLNTLDVPVVQLIANGTLIGSFEVPVTVPILTEGLTNLVLVPLVKENASTQNFEPYRVFDPFRDTLQLSPLQVDTVSPTLRYRNNAQFDWLVDFEDQSLKFEKTGNNNTNDSILVIPMSTPGVDAPFSGSQYCGYIRMSAGANEKILERSTIGEYKLPNRDQDVYVEIDIKSNTGLQVGIYADDGQTLIKTPVLAIFPTDGTWKKIYVNLKPETGFLPAGTKVKVFFAMYHSGEDAGFVPETYIDNLKLVYLK